jgi:hypothetical protein
MLVTLMVSNILHKDRDQVSRVKYELILNVNKNL